MKEKFNTLFIVKTSLISLYLALTIPLPFISNEKLKIFSIILFFLGLFLIFNITNDYLETTSQKIIYKSSFLSKTFGKKNWEIFWTDIRSIKALPTSQGSKVYYFVNNKDDNYLLPQRLENYEKFLLLITKKTGLNVEGFSYISPLWTYRLLTFLSLLMILGELIAFLI